MAGVNYCSACGTALPPTGRFCPNCGQQTIAVPQSALPVSAPPTTGQPRVHTCPGCKTTAGPAGALCPACGSRYPSPGMVGPAIVIAIVGAVALGVGALIHAGDKSAGQSVEGFGVLGIIIGVGMLVYASGRTGPAQQQSCCGCSCMVLLLLLPAGALALNAAGGPHLAVLALPAWVPSAWLLDAVALRFSKLSGLSRPREALSRIPRRDRSS